mgnify:CR=1 FL=1
MRLEKNIVFTPLLKKLDNRSFLTSNLLLKNQKTITYRTFYIIKKHLLFKSIVLSKDIYQVQEEFVILDNLFYPVLGGYYCD